MAKLRYGAVVGLLSSMTLGSTVHVPPTFLNGSISMEKFSVAGNLDGFKMTTAANKTSFDFWYFDAMSTSDDAAINIVFFNTDNLKNPSPLAVQISGTFPNDTQFSGQTLASDGADIRNDEHGVSGDWSGAGASFRGTNLEDANAEYEITFDAPSIGLEGTVKLQSRAPAHYPCDLNAPGVNQNLLPNLFWADAVPDADAGIDLVTNGTSFNTINGIGYHDKNWGHASVITSPKYWDWGHARSGPYSVVWYDLVDYNNTEHVSAYAVRDGEAIQVSCADTALQVRQCGNNGTYPPAAGLAEAKSLTAQFDLGAEGVLVANVTKGLIVHNDVVYARAVGSVNGGIKGKESFEGRAFFEEFVYGLLFE